MVKSIGFGFSPCNSIIEFFFIHDPVVANFIRQFEADDCAFSGRNVLEIIPCCAFGPHSFRIHGFNATFDNPFVECILDERSFVLSSPEFGEIGLVFSKQHL
jgi:hypothetical protein